MPKTLMAAVIVSTCLMSSLAEAQTGGSPGGSTIGATFQAPPPPPPPAPPAQPQQPSPAGTLVPTPAPSALDSGADVFRARPRTYAPRFDRSARRNRFYGYGASGYITDPFGYISQPESSAPELDRYMRAGKESGYLRIDVEPGTARVYVDGLYLGTVDEFRGDGRALDSGTHRVEIRADGFDPVTFDVGIRPDDVVSYRGALARREQRAEMRPAGPAKTFYVIPRCYAGDSRPRAEQLPKGCRVENLRAIPPVVAPSARP